LPSLLREETFEPARVERIWRSVAAERARRTQRGAGDRRLAFGLGVCLVGALAAGLWVMRAQLPDAPPQADFARPTSHALSITRSDGSALGQVQGGAAEPVRVALSDGSSIEVQARGVLSPVELSARRVVLRLQRGAARFAVRPGGPRRWVIEAGPATVEVIGTRFEVLLELESTRVRVEHGVVRVRAQGRGVVQLRAGQEVTVSGADGAPIAATASTPDTSDPSAGSTNLSGGPPESASIEPATAAPGASAPNRSAPGIEALLAEADRLRMARKPEAAAQVLGRALREHAGDPRAALAAFTLARLREQSLRDPRGAAEAYAQALALGLSPTLAQSARAHLARAWLAAGAPAAAARAAREYLSRHEDGADAPAMRALLQAAVTPSAPGASPSSTP
jgi:transmembrane sensor